MKKTKWGIIAAGGIALRRTIPAMGFCENGEIVAVMDKNPNALAYIKEKIPPVPGTFEMHTKENAAIGKHFI